MMISLISSTTTQDDISNNLDNISNMLDTRVEFSDEK